MTLGNPDPKFWRRLLLAFGIAIAIHEIVIGAGGFLRFPHTDNTPGPLPSVFKITTVAIVSPPPTPTPTPAPKVTPALVRTVAAPRATFVARKTGGSKGGPKLEVHVPKMVHHSTPVPVVRATERSTKVVANLGAGPSPAPSAGQSVGQGTGQGSGAGSQTGAAGGTGGTGSGVNADVPCGEPIFYGIRAKFNPKDGSFDEDVRVELHMANGQTLTGDFHYPWHYASEKTNPFSPNWQGGPDDPIPAKLPPPGYDLSREPLAVQLTISNTLPNGTTRFAPCPTAKSP